ncbi:MAG: hypothetical protein ACFB4J_11360 [Elainellaceae cyanobacterium]
MTQATDATFNQVYKWMILGESRPAAEQVVPALLAAEKASRGSSAVQERSTWTYRELLGPWRLSFITGTRSSRQRAGVVLGPGRFVPRWVEISLTYCAPEKGPEKGPDNALDTAPVGRVQNRVAIAGAAMTVSGPTKPWPRGILAFDFTRMTLDLGGWSPIDTQIRNGAEREAAFNQQPLKAQAFFRYFLVAPNYAAARGRGGGLALWVRDR